MRSTLMIQSSSVFYLLRTFSLRCAILCCLFVGHVFAHTPADPSIGAPDPFMAWKTLRLNIFVSITKRSMLPTRKKWQQPPSKFIRKQPHG